LYNVCQLDNTLKKAWRQAAADARYRIRSVATTVPVKATFGPGPANRNTEMEAEADMNWTTPVITEICIGMEVTSYLSAEI
jgi:coenzyme PQQ precursor peptide PqqA